MHPGHSSFNAYLDVPSLSPDTSDSDSLDEFLSYFFDLPSVGLTSVTAPEHESAPAHAPPVPSLPHPTCLWVSPADPPFFCGASVSSDPRHACEHFRLAHNVRGNEKVMVNCLWHACRAPPMQRGSLIRHLLAVHLGLLRWQCERCGRVFSRKGTGHMCSGPR